MNSNPSPNAHPRWQEIISGFRDELPILMGVIPYGLIYGVLALSAGMTPVLAQATSAIVFAGSSQIVATDLIRSGAPEIVIVLTIFVVNLRHALYSASLAPYVQHLPRRWQLLLAYLLTDEAFAVSVSRYHREQEHPHTHWYFLSAGVTLWSGWQISSLVGVLLGAQIPASWGLGFTLALTFIALVMPALKQKAGLASALAGGLTALLAFNLPYKLGLLLAALVGIIAGMLVEEKWPPRSG